MDSALSDDGSLSFRHEALTVLCAADVCAALERRDSLALADWQHAAPLAGEVCEYASELASGRALLGAAAILGSDVQFNVLQLATAVLEAAKGREALGDVPADWAEEPTIAAICHGVLGAPHVVLLPTELLLRAVGARRAFQVEVPLLLLLARSELPDPVDVAAAVLQRMSPRGRNFCEDLGRIKENQSSLVDSMLLRDLRVEVRELVDSSSYQSLFERIHAVPDERQESSSMQPNLSL